MTQHQIDDIVSRATRGVKTINNKEIDPAIAYRAIELFADAYEKRNRDRYRGEITRGDLARILNAYGTCKDRYTLLTEANATAFFRSMRDNEKARAATFADWAGYISSRVYAKMYGIK